MTSIYRMRGGLLVAHFIVARSQLCHGAAHSTGARGSIIVARDFSLLYVQGCRKMIRTAIIFTFVAFALGSSSHAGNVQVNFSGGSGGPLTITLPQAVSFTVTNDTASLSANFVFQGVGNVLGSSVRGAAGSMSYTTNGGSALSINSVGNFNLGGVTTNDLTVFKNASAGVNLGDVLVLSNGSVTTTTNVSAAAPPSGLYSAIFVDVNGTPSLNWCVGGVSDLAGF
jgi:hypothetical protein